MTYDESLRAIQEATMATIEELKRLNAEERAIYDRLFHELEAAKIRDIEEKIAGEKKAGKAE